MSSNTKKTISILILTALALVIGLLPWRFLAFGETNVFVKWIRDSSLLMWGWFVVLVLAGCALNETRKWNFTPLFLKRIIMGLITSALVLALIWLLFVLFSYSISSSLA